MPNRTTHILEELLAAAQGTAAIIVGDRKAPSYFDFSARGLAGSFIALLVATTFSAYLPVLTGTADDGLSPGQELLTVGVLVAMQIANGAATLLMAWGFSGWRPSRPGIDRDALHLVRFGGTVTGYNLLGYLITNLDNILIGARFGAGPLGIYDRAYKLMFQPLWQMTAPAARVAVPLLSRLADDAAEYRKSYLAMLGGILALTTPGILCAIVFAHPVIVVLLGERWAASAPICGWLGVCALTLQLRQAASWLFVSQGRAEEQLKWGGLGSAVVILGYLVGIFWGPKGVAVSAAVTSGLVQIPMMWWAVTRSGPVSRADALRLLLPLIVATAVSGGVLGLLSGAAIWSSFGGLVLAVLVAYALFGAALALFPSGRAQMRRAIGMARRFRRA